MTTPAPDGRCVGVVFDLDGVLVESEHLWEESWTAQSAAAGYAWRHDDTAACQGMSVPEWSRYMAARLGGDPAAIADAVIDRMIAALAAGRIELLRGAASMVADAAARAPIAVASSAPRRLIEAVLTTTGLRPSFTAVVSSAEVARGKPSPDVYAEAARRIGRDPARCAAVEDSSNGIRAAAAAGMLVIAIPNPVYPPRPDALALCAKIAASADDARRFLLERLPDPESEPEDATR